MSELSEPDPALTPLKKPRRLTLKQRSFIANYTDPQSPTFGNGTRSVIAVTGRDGNEISARSQASEYLANPHIRSEIEQRIEEAGIEDRVRLRALRSVIMGEYMQTERTGRRGKVTYRSPKAAEIVKAVETVNRMSGLYEKNRAQFSALSSRFRELAKQYAPRQDAVPVRATVHKSIHAKAQLCFGLLVLSACKRTKRIQAQAEQSAS